VLRLFPLPFFQYYSVVVCLYVPWSATQPRRIAPISPFLPFPSRYGNARIVPSPFLSLAGERQLSFSPPSRAVDPEDVFFPLFFLSRIDRFLSSKRKGAVCVFWLPLRVSMPIQQATQTPLSYPLSRWNSGHFSPSLPKRRRFLSLVCSSTPCDGTFLPFFFLFLSARL